MNNKLLTFIAILHLTTLKMNKLTAFIPLRPRM